MLPGNLGNGAVTTAKIAAGAVIASSIKNGVVTTNKLNGNANVTTAKLRRRRRHRNAKLGGPKSTPLLGTLKSGQTLRGAFDLGGDAQAESANRRAGAISFQFPLRRPRRGAGADSLAPDQQPHCLPGLGGGNQTDPEAAAGQLCVYMTRRPTSTPTPSSTPTNVYPPRLRPEAKLKAAAADNFRPTASGR